MSNRLKVRQSLVTVPVIAAVLAGALAGCGNETDEEQITSAARQFSADIRDNDWKGVCDSFSKKAKAQVAAAGAAAGIPDCPAFIERAFSANAGFNNLADVKPDDVKVTKITIKGDNATAEVVPSNDQDPTTYFAYEGGKWKIDADPPPAKEPAKEATTGSGSG